MRLLICSEELPATPREWVKIATVGEWRGYGKSGAKLAVSDLEAALDFFAATGTPAGGADGLIDYEHDSIRLAKGELTGKDADAAGWFKQLELRDGAAGSELWMRPSWTPPAEAKLAAREKRYVSPAFLFGRKHPVSGEPIRCVLDSVALTNKPFFRHLPDVAASDLAAAFGAEPDHTPPTAFQGFAVDLLVSKAEPMGDGPCYAGGELACDVHAAEAFGEIRSHELVGGITILLGRYEGTDRWDTCGFRFDAALWPHARAREWLDEHRFTGELTATAQEAETVDRTALIASLGMAEDASDEQVTGKVKGLVLLAATMAALMPAVPTALGLGDDADAEAILASIEGLKAKAAAPPEGGDARVLVATTALGLAADASAEDIAKALKARQDVVAGDQAARLVDEAIKDKRVIPPAMREQWLAQARKDFSGTASLIASMPPILSQPSGDTPPPDEGETTLTDEEKRIGTLFGCDLKDLAAVKKGRALVGA